MAKYVIYDGVSPVYTPSGKKFTSEEWLAMYTWAEVTPMVLSGNAINGSMVAPFDEMVSSYKQRGANFASCKDNEDYLAVMEEFDEQMTKEVVNDQTRIADALEDLIVILELNKTIIEGE